MILSQLRVTETHSRNNDGLVLLKFGSARDVQSLRGTNRRPERLRVQHPETLRFISRVAGPRDGTADKRLGASGRKGGTAAFRKV